MKTPIVWLEELLRALPGVEVPDMDRIPVTGVCSDSRQVSPGNVFVALTGGHTDGHQYIPEAIRQGAAAVVGSRSGMHLEVPYIRVSDTRLALAHLSAAFWGYPARRMTVIGVTGTDGKTTTANLIYHILRESGLKAGMISTVSAQIGERSLDTGFHVTTPEAPEVQRYLAEMVSAGLTHVVLEATSHGLAQQRVAACEFDLAAVTNITHEHLDYHGSYEAYLQAKGRLFEALAVTAEKPGGNYRVAVLNRDDGSYPFLKELLEPLTPPLRIFTYGLHADAMIKADQLVSDARGLRFIARWDQRQWNIQTKLLGEYNVSNCLAAIAVTAAGLGLESEAIRRGIAAFRGVPGRMEAIRMGQDFLAFVDFAHTPNALRQTLQTARRLTQGRVIAVFGSAGLRDRAKRRMMAEVSAELADVTILTAEDPRTESLDAILEEMAAGVLSRGGMEGKTFWRVPDRGQALRRAVSLAQPGDLVIACGKGHEQSMCFGTREYPWDDRQALRAAIAEKLGLEAPEMPYLPTREK